MLDNFILDLPPLKNSNITTPSKIYFLFDGLCDIDQQQRIEQLCLRAIQDKRLSNNVECYQIDNWQTNSSCVFYQFYNKMMHLVLVVTPQGDALFGWSKFKNIAVVARRTYCDVGLRNKNIFSYLVMPYLEKLFIDCDINYVVFNVNTTERGIKHYKLYNSHQRLKKILTAGLYFDSFIPLTNYPVTFFNVPQYVFYKKLNTDYALTEAYLKECCQ